MATPSLAMIPSGYKDGKLYSVLPNNAGGDFDVTRGSLATRVNESGLIEPVGTLGADVVLNGDFEEVGADQILNGDFSQEGVEEITNGNFATDTDWVKEATWTIENGVANGNGASGSASELTQNNVNTIGKTYKATFDVLNYVSGSVGFWRGSGITVVDRNANGTYTEYFTATSAEIRFRPNTFVGSIDNVSVVEVGQNWDLTNNVGSSTNISNVLNIVTDGDFTNAEQNGILTLDKNYALTYTVASNAVVGILQATIGTAAVNVAVPSTVGTHTVYFKSEGNDFAFKRGGGALNVSIDNIIIKEVGQEWTLTDGCSITAQGARITSDGTYQDISQVGVMVIGDTYEIEYEITESVSGTLSVTGSFVGINLKNTVGVHKFYAVSGSSSLQIKRAGVCDITIDNIKIKRLNGDDTPRVDYTDGGCPVLLTEPQSTNLITQSNDFSASSWTKTGTASVTDNTTISPDGTQNADTINLLSGNFLYQSVAGAGTFTMSCYVKVPSGTLDFKMQTFSSTDGAIQSSLFVATTEWQRFEHTVTVTVDSAFHPIQVSSLLGGDFEVYGAQVEQLSYATSYIPTYGAVRTRLQDTVSGAGTSSDFNSEEGVLFAEISVLSDDSTLKSLCINDGTSGNRVIIQYSNASNRLTADVRVGAVGQAFMQTFDYNVTDLLRIAVKYKANDFALWVNGLEVATVNSGLTFSANTLSKLSFDAGNSGDPFLGKTSQVQVFKTALSDAELQTLTTI